MATIFPKRLLVLFFWLHAMVCSFSQTGSYPVKELVKKLSATNGPSSSGINEVFTTIKDKDSAQVFRFFNELEKLGTGKNNFFIARLQEAKIFWCIKSGLSLWYVPSIDDWAKQALNTAYEINDDSLIADIAWVYGIACYQAEKTEPAAMYLLLAVETDEKLGRIPDAWKCLWLSAVLYKTRDYKKAIYYTLASIQREKDTSAINRRLIISRYNTIGVCYQRINNYDSAFYYYDIAMKMAIEQKDMLWQAIISGNKGQIYYLQKNYSAAKKLLEFDYNITKNTTEQLSAANTLQWIARIELHEGKKDSAFLHVKQAMMLMQNKNDHAWANYRQNIYYAAAEVHRAFGNKDSALKYTELYNTLRDSIERSVADSRLEISRIRLDNLQNSLFIKNLQKQKIAEGQKRNLVIVLIILVSIIALLYINRLRLKHVHKENLVRQEKAATEALAREQLELLTQKITEKTNLAEELQKQLNSRSQAVEQQQLAATISNLTILTETDWEKFKKLFEELYPGFFMNLQEKVSDITVAELRMAALTRLHLSTNQIASILGISANSVYKTKQRLRNRLNIHPESNIEEAIANI